MLIFPSNDFVLHPKESDYTQKKTCHLKGKNKRKQEKDPQKSRLECIMNALLPIDRQPLKQSIVWNVLEEGTQDYQMSYWEKMLNLPEMIQTIISTYKLFIILRYVIKSNTNKRKSLTRQKHHCESRESLLKPHKKHSRNLCTLPSSFSPLMYFTSVYFKMSAFFFPNSPPFSISLHKTKHRDNNTQTMCVQTCMWEYIMKT